VVFKEKGRAIIGLVKTAGEDSINITRGTQAERTIARELVIGPVVSQLRRRAGRTPIKPTAPLCFAEIILLLAGLSMWGAGKVKKRPGLEQSGQYVLYAWFIIAVFYALFLF
jgi:hypothetical protein